MTVVERILNETLEYRPREAGSSVFSARVVSASAALSIPCQGGCVPVLVKNFWEAFLATARSIQAYDHPGSKRFIELC